MLSVLGKKSGKISLSICTCLSFLFSNSSNLFGLKFCWSLVIKEIASSVRIVLYAGVSEALIENMVKKFYAILIIKA
jgi:hypothetical protein